MKLHQLQALVTSAEMGSIRGAARSLGISQAAVTRALRELEAAEQLPLLNRTPSGLTFTQFGTALLTHARLVLNQMDQARSEMAELRGQAEGRLGLAISPWIMHSFLPETLQEFRKRFPSIRLELYESLMSIAQPLLRDGKIDLVLGYLHPSLQNQEYTAEPILHYQTSVMVRQGHTHQACETIHQLLETDWALNYAADGRDAIIHHLFGRFNAHIDEKRIIQAHSTTALQSMVEYSDMATWAPTVLSYMRPYRDQLAIVPLKEDFERVQLSIITRRNNPHSNAVMCFIDCLKSVIRRHSRLTTQNSKEIFSTIKIEY